MSKTGTQLYLGLNKRGPVPFESEEEDFLHLTGKLSQTVQRSCREGREHLGPEKFEYFLRRIK